MDVMTEITIAFGTETGNSESLALDTSKKLQSLGYPSSVVNLEDFTLDDLSRAQVLLIITSTYGEGEPPENARDFYEDLMDAQLSLQHLQFSVCALGDRDYDLFCQCGKDFDERLAELGAKRFAPRVDCDADYIEYDDWLVGVESGIQKVLGGNRGAAGAASVSPAQAPQASQAPKAPNLQASQAPPARAPVAALAQPPVGLSQLEPSGTASPDPFGDTVRTDLNKVNRSARSSDLPALGTKKRPLFAEIVENRNLNHPESSKETRHVCISLDGIETQYQVGDALGVYPRNQSDLINEALHYLGLNREEWVEFEGEYFNLFYLLKYRKDIVQIDNRLFELIQPQLAPPHLQNIAQDRKAARAYTDAHHVIDLLRTGCIRPTATEFINSLRTLSPRLYSISSSPKAHPGYVHLTVDVLRYDLHGSARHGVASNFLCDSEVGGHVAVYVHPTKDFKLCAPEKPIIMIGPGTGIAPFKAMLEEREITRAPGKSWLFFGAQKSRYDFLYRELLEGWENRGVLSQLNCAWSRDQSHKVYVQDLMYQHRVGIWRWLEAGAYIYICGDAKRMAKDVHATFVRIISEQGQRSQDLAEDYMTQLKRDKRYLRDVY